MVLKVSVLQTLSMVCMYMRMHTQKHIHKIYQMKEKMKFQIKKKDGISNEFTYYYFNDL